ncbi:MAG TPA: radical SAM family heme chaperone HemW [Candidatus Kapabacteria bacterium]|nr:radical SAM family heme chaperone HemW [Candidatus Kapabacteria bacterium]
MNHSSGISAYLHIPFCEKKCIYCDFYSIENLSLRSEFVDLLIREIDLKLEANPNLRGRTLETIFFGGGTPSLLTPSELERIIRKLEEHFGISRDCEFTLECNPGTITLEKLRGYKSLGVNRLSFGVQSFDAEELKFLGRIHDAAQAREAVALARQAGFDNVSIDLIFALPGQTETTLNHTLDEAIALETNHVSAYNLIVERGTPLFRLVQLGKVIELDSDRSAALFSLVQNRLQEAGFEQYEISNYAHIPPPKEGGGQGVVKRAKHNLVYWDSSKDYVSFGPSAHEFIGGERAWNVSSLEEYGKAIRAGKLPIINREQLTMEERRTEVLYLQLRSTGIRVNEFMEVFGEDLLLNSDVHAFIEEGWMNIVGGLLKLTAEGYRFCDAIVTRLMATEHRSDTRPSASLHSESSILNILSIL